MKRIYSNCFFGLLYLVLRGKVNRIVALSSESKKWPYHFVVLNKRGHAIHFQFASLSGENDVVPWWFLGSLKGISRRQQKRMLEESGRKICWSIKYNKFILLLLLLIWCILFIPWVLGWMIYPIVWNFKWLCKIERN